jgi:hypothetical protein
MGISFPFSILLGAAGLSVLLSIFLNVQESSRVTLSWMNPNRFPSPNGNRNLAQGHETDRRIAEEYVTSLKSLSLRERQLSLQV